MFHQRITFFFAACISLCFSDPRPDSLPYISGDTFRAHADHIFDETTPTFSPERVRRGDTIFINLSHMQEFFENIHPLIEFPYILISMNHDFSAPAQYTPFLEDPKLIAWFTQNPDLTGHQKLIPVPTGLSNCHWKFASRHPETIGRVKGGLPPYLWKKYLLYVNFEITTNPSLRKPIREYFQNHVPFCKMVDVRPFHQYIRELAQSKFVLSPHGGGLDCHRTWEAMYMGSFPIVKTSTLDPLYEGLPVLIVQDWTDITEEFLERKYLEMKELPYQMEKLYFNYWLEKIRQLQTIWREL